jgi:hypothetical protein
MVCAQCEKGFFEGKTELQLETIGENGEIEAKCKHHDLMIQRPIIYQMDVRQLPCLWPKQETK